MKYTYNFSEQNEVFGKKVYDLLVENFSQTFFTGGTVRDIIFKLRIGDIDITTSALPDEVKILLSGNHIKFDDTNSRYGVITANGENGEAGITTLRNESYKDTRYPKVEFIGSLYQDSLRRDFTINSLYFKPEIEEITDFHNGIQHAQEKRLVFIGDVLNKITEDPLRIVRAYRFMYSLNLTMDAATEYVLQNNLFLLKNISQKKIISELDKISSQETRNKVLKVMHKYT